MADDGKGISGATWRSLMDEAETSRGRRRLHGVVSLILVLLLVAVLPSGRVLKFRKA